MPLRLVMNRTVQVAIDAAILSLAFWSAFLFRFEFRIPSLYFRLLLVTWPYVVLLQYGSLAAFGVPRLSWRYINIGDVTRVLVGIAAATAVMVTIRLIGPLVGSQHLGLFVIPIGVIAMNFALAFLGLVGIRALRRLQGEASDRKQKDAGSERHRVLL